MLMLLEATLPGHSSLASMQIFVCLSTNLFPPLQPFVFIRQVNGITTLFHLRKFNFIRFSSYSLWSDLIKKCVFNSLILTEFKKYTKQCPHFANYSFIKISKECVHLLIYKIHLIKN